MVGAHNDFCHLLLVGEGWQIIILGDGIVPKHLQEIARILCLEAAQPQPAGLQCRKAGKKRFAAHLDGA